ncbi:histidine kinase [Kineococcus sp. NUM-3379]
MRAATPADPAERSARAPSWRDGVLVAVLVLLVVLEAVLRPELPSRGVWAALTVALAPALLWRRSRPVRATALVFGATCVAALATGGSGEMFSAVFFLLLPWSLFRWASTRGAAAGSAVVVAGAVVPAVAGDAPAADLLGGLAVLTATAALGTAARHRAASRRRALEQVRLLERERLARDLHDTVAHHVSAIAIRAQAGLATSGTDPGAAAGALAVIEAEASRALAEMRALVRVLREAGTEPPGPHAGDLARLAEPQPDGPPVRLEVTGDLAGVSPLVGAAVYRIAQESVTNARRHARRATSIDVSVTADDDAVRLRVHDDGESVPARPAAGRGPGGQGIPGMVERAGLLGGTCEAGPGAGRGWTVSAVLPRGPLA